MADLTRTAQNTSSRGIRVTPQGMANVNGLRAQAAAMGSAVDHAGNIGEMFSRDLAERRQEEGRRAGLAAGADGDINALYARIASVDEGTVAGKAKRQAMMVLAAEMTTSQMGVVASQLSEQYQADPEGFQTAARERFELLVEDAPPDLQGAVAADGLAIIGRGAAHISANVNKIARANAVATAGQRADQIQNEFLTDITSFGTFDTIGELKDGMERIEAEETRVRRLMAATNEVHPGAFLDADIEARVVAMRTNAMGTIIGVRAMHRLLAAEGDPAAVGAAHDENAQEMAAFVRGEKDTGEIDDPAMRSAAVKLAKAYVADYESGVADARKREAARTDAAAIQTKTRWDARIANGEVGEWEIEAAAAVGVFHDDVVKNQTVAAGLIRDLRTRKNAAQKRLQKVSDAAASLDLLHGRGQATADNPTAVGNVKTIVDYWVEQGLDPTGPEVQNIVTTYGIVPEDYATTMTSNVYNQSPEQAATAAQILHDATAGPHGAAVTRQLERILGSGFGDLNDVIERVVERGQGMTQARDEVRASSVARARTPEVQRVKTARDWVDANPAAFDEMVDKVAGDVWPKSLLGTIFSLHELADDIGIALDRANINDNIERDGIENPRFREQLAQAFASKRAHTESDEVAMRGALASMAQRWGAAPGDDDVLMENPPSLFPDLAGPDGDTSHHLDAAALAVMTELMGPEGDLSGLTPEGQRTLDWLQDRARDEKLRLIPRPETAGAGRTPAYKVEVITEDGDIVYFFGDRDWRPSYAPQTDKAGRVINPGSPQWYLDTEAELKTVFKDVPVVGDVEAFLRKSSARLGDWLVNRSAERLERRQGAIEAMRQGSTVPTPPVTTDERGVPSVTVPIDGALLEAAPGGPGPTVQLGKRAVPKIVNTPRSSGAEVVAQSLDVVDSLGLGAPAKDILTEFAVVESNRGRHGDTYRVTPTSPALGIWQHTKVGFASTQDVASHPGLKKAHAIIKDALGIDWMKVTREDLDKPLYAALAARLWLLNRPEKLPETLEERAAYWADRYNSKLDKNGTADFYLRKIVRAGMVG